MRIGIDGRLAYQTGVGRYIRNLIKYLRIFDKKNEYVLFVRTEDYENLKNQITNIQDKDDAIHDSKLRNWKLVIADVKWHTLREQIQMLSIINKENLDLVHFPYFSVPLLYTKPFVVTIHDLIIDHFPTGKASSLPLPFYLIKRIAYKTIMNFITKRSKYIITPSKATKNEIINHYHVPEDKIGVTYEGGFDKRISNYQYQISNFKYKKYFLYVGNAYPHKNLDMLIQAYRIFKRSFPTDIKLILVGKEDFFYKKLKQKIIEDIDKKNIIMFGKASDSELEYLYNHADALIVPSLMEGFGLTALEALSMGCMVISAKIEALSEICEREAFYFQPDNIPDLVDKMIMVYKLDKKEVIEKKLKARDRAKLFSWEKMAESTLNIYESCVSV